MSPARRSRSRKPAGGATEHRATRHSSQPTGRAAYTDTRRWLLESHGPICAYCALKFAPTSLTLDHVTPRRGQTAYDRRDNLVLACKRCNAAKADKSFLAYLLGQRARAVNLLRYGTHLSPGILDIIRPLAEGFAGPEPPASKPPRPVYGAEPDDGDSPYREDAPSPAKGGARRRRSRRRR